MTAAVALPLWGTDGDADFPPGSTLDRFFTKVEVGDCWLWVGATDRGYGKFYPHRKTVRAHRWLYEQLVGPVPAGMDLDHLCRVRACVNPDHLEVVTRSVNLARSPLMVRPPRRGVKSARGRSASPSCGAAGPSSAEQQLRASGQPGAGGPP